MVSAYIIFPDVFLSALEKKGEDDVTYSKSFLTKLLNEKFRICTNETKQFRGYISNYHWDCLVEILVDMLASKNMTEEEISIIQIILSSVERDGIEKYPYKDNHTPILDLAKDKSDSFDIYLVCNNEETKYKLKEMMKKYSHFGTYPILSAKEACLNL